MTIDREKVALAGGMTLSEVRALGHEGKALAVMITGAMRCAKDLYQKGEIEGILGWEVGREPHWYRCHARLPIGFRSDDFFNAVPQYAGSCRDKRHLMLYSVVIFPGSIG